jgi:hypothetical protein
MPARYSASAVVAACILAGTAGAAAAVAFQAAAPARAADIHPESLSRVPPVDRASLDAEGQRIYDVLAGGRPLGRTGPGAVSMHSPKAAEPVQALNH